MKTCTKCRAEKSLDYFPADSSKSDGKHSWCKVCRNGRAKERYRADPDAHADRVKRYRKQNPEKVKDWDFTFRQSETRRKWRNLPENRDKERNRSRIYATTNKERIYERQRRWRANNPDRARAIYRRAADRRRAIERGKFVEVVEFEEVQKRDNDTCYLCDTVVRTNATLEHIIPLSRGGSHCYSNVALACKSCNSKKSNKLPEELTEPFKSRVELRLLRGG